MNHIVSDFIIRIKNATMARRREVVLPYSKLTKSIADVLVKEGVLESVSEEEIDARKVLKARVKYDRRNAVVSNVEIISKPSLRVYMRAGDIIKREKKRLSTVIVSTNHGVMTGKEAQKQGVGGELLFEVW